MASFGAPDEQGTVSFASSNAAVASVGETGYVSFLKSGTAKITARTHNGLKVKLTVKVVKAPSRVTLSSASGQPKDQVSYDLLKTDAAYVRQADGSWAAGQPSAPASAQ